MYNYSHAQMEEMNQVIQDAQYVPHQPSPAATLDWVTAHTAQGLAQFLTGLKSLILANNATLVESIRDTIQTITVKSPFQEYSDESAG